MKFTKATIISFALLACAMSPISAELRAKEDEQGWPDALAAPEDRNLKSRATEELPANAEEVVLLVDETETPDADGKVSGVIAFTAEDTEKGKAFTKRKVEEAEDEAEQQAIDDEEEEKSHDVRSYGNDDPKSNPWKKGGYGESKLLRGYKTITVPWKREGVKYVPKRFYVYGRVKITRPYYRRVTNIVENLGVGKAKVEHAKPKVVHGGFVTKPVYKTIKVENKKSYGHDNSGYGHDNSGYGNSGYGNSGYGNSGYGNDNSGYGNSGYGHDNSGYGNSGYGHDNSGYGNSGYGNSGYDNSGYGNSGYDNSGYGNSGYGKSY